MLPEEKMDDISNFFTASHETFISCDIFEEYDEKLEAEFIMRARSIFDEFVCPRTGIIMITTFGELLHGINRLWSLAQEMKGFTRDIHERLINLPFLFILSLLRLIEKEYCLEDYEKTPADPQLSETLLNIFMQMYKKVGHFKRYPSQRILLYTSLMYLRHLLMITNMDKSIQRIKWNELRVKRVFIDCPIRETDLTQFLESLRYFRSEILPFYSKRPCPYILVFHNRFPEIMEPTLELQNESSNFIFIISTWMLVFSIIFILISSSVDAVYESGTSSSISMKVNNNTGTGDRHIRINNPEDEDIFNFFKNLITTTSGNVNKAKT